MPPGIYPLPSGGYRAVACISRTQRREKRFPKGTPLRTITKWQERTRTALAAERPRTRDHSLEADVTTYLAAKAAMPTYAVRKRHLELWAQALGPSRARDTVRAPEIAAILERWRLNGWSGATCNRLRTALQNFYTVLNGKSGANPVRDVAKYREPQRPPKPLSYALFEAILAEMPDDGRAGKGKLRPRVSQSKARLRVMAFTGLPPIQIMRLKPEHLRDDRTVYVAGRLKGSGTDDVVLPLSERGYQALTALFACNGHHAFGTSPLRRSFRTAACKLGRPDLTPYDLRHLFGTTVLRSSLNRAATRDLMLHATDTTTARYARTAIPAERWAAVRAFEAEVEADVVGGRCGSGQTGPEDPSLKRRLLRLSGRQAG